MRKLYRFGLFLFIFALYALSSLTAQQLPRPTGFVNDFAGIMTAQDVEAVQNLAAAVKEKTGAEIVLVTVKTMAPYGSIDEYSIALAEAWDIGEKGKDNGVLLIFAMDERKVRIEVGYGLEGAIPDSAAGRILDTVVIPAFRDGDFSGGLVQGYRVIAVYAAKENGIDLAEFDLTETETAYSMERDNLPGIPSWIFTIISFIIMVSFSLLFQLLLRKLGIKSGRSSGSFGSGSSFGSSGGSFGGFSGGSFGGGGASRGF